MHLCNLNRGKNSEHQSHYTNSVQIFFFYAMKKSFRLFDNSWINYSQSFSNVHPKKIFFFKFRKFWEKKEKSQWKKTPLFLLANRVWNFIYILSVSHRCLPSFREKNPPRVFFSAKIFSLWNRSSIFFSLLQGFLIYFKEKALSLKILSFF